MKWIETGVTLDKESLCSPMSSSVLSTLPGGNLTQKIEELISRSVTGDWLRIISPVIDDNEIVKLIHEARNRGVVVRVLTTLNDRHGIGTRGWDSSQNINAHETSIRTIAQTGVLLRSPLTTPHGKLIHLSGMSAIFGSMNLTTSSLRGDSLESGILIQAKDTLSNLETAFDHIWNRSCFYMKHNQNGDITVEERNTPAGIDPPEMTARDGTIVLIAEPGLSSTCNHLTELVNGAQRNITLVAMSLYETNKIPQLGDALLSALKREVSVHAVVRQEHFQRQEQRGEYPDAGTRELIRNGMKLCGIKGLHAKGFLIDDIWCGIQSANFNPFSLDTRLDACNGRDGCNVELFMIGHTAQEPMRSYAGFLSALVKNATHLMKLEE